MLKGKVDLGVREPQALLLFMVAGKVRPISEVTVFRLERLRHRLLVW